MSKCVKRRIFRAKLYFFAAIFLHDEKLFEKKLFQKNYSKRNYSKINYSKRNYSKRNCSNINYENLEFLGDRVLGLTISEKLIELYPNEKVGILDKKLASLINKNKCYEVGKILNLHRFIVIGNSNKKKIVFQFGWRSEHIGAKPPLGTALKNVVF